MKIDTHAMNKAINQWERRVMGKIDEGDPVLVEMVEEKASYLHKAVRDLVAFAFDDLTDKEFTSVAETKRG